MEKALKSLDDEAQVKKFFELVENNILTKKALNVGFRMVCTGERLVMRDYTTIEQSAEADLILRDFIEPKLSCEDNMLDVYNNLPDVVELYKCVNDEDVEDVESGNYGFLGYMFAKDAEEAKILYDGIEGDNVAKFSIPKDLIKCVYDAGDVLGYVVDLTGDDDRVTGSIIEE